LIWPKNAVLNFFLAQNLKTLRYNFKLVVSYIVSGMDEIVKSSQGDNSVKPCNLHIKKTLSLVEEMIALADQGDTHRKKLAEEEKENHINKGWWPGEQ
jgi:hypothetical protein